MPLRRLGNAYVALFGRRAFAPFNERLLSLAQRGLGMGNPIAQGAMVDAAEDAFLRRLAGVEELTVFDVGAYLGEYARHVRRYSPQARIVAFEPHPASYARLREVADELGFTAVNAALGESPGRSRLYDYADLEAAVGSPHASLHSPVIEAVHGRAAAGIEVAVTTVDEAMREHGIERVGLLKIDAEGHELAVLAGARGALAGDRVDLVEFEFNEMNVISRTFFRDFYEALPGFDFCRLLADGLLPLGPYRPRTHEHFVLQNVVAVRRGLAFARDLL